ncbi:MAG: hypothetical protein ABSA44_07255 [Bacteroidota bacterium]|jgi:hypothetical protein
MKRLSMFFFLMISLVHCSFSQGEFIKRGTSGIEGGAGFSANSEMNEKTLYAGFSYKGFIDANIAYWKASGGKVQDGVLSPSITYYLVKQEDAKKTPTLGVSLGYSHYKSKSTSLVDVPESIAQHRTDTIKTDLTVDAVKLGISAYRRTGYWKAFFFQPMIGADVLMASPGWEFTLRGGVAIGSRIRGGPLLILTPSIERQSDVTTFVLTFSVVS